LNFFFRKKEEVALYLLEKGADANATNSKKRTALHLAAYHNFPEVIKTLVQKGADPNAKVCLR
jgi:ankyrin repeat protein